CRPGISSCDRGGDRMSRRIRGPLRRRRISAGLFVALVAALGMPIMALSAPPAAANPVTGAVNTTDDPLWNGPNNDGLDLNGNPILGTPTQACLNGGPHTLPAVNCNIYQNKT